MDQLIEDTDLRYGTLDFLYVIIRNEGLSQKKLSEHLRIGKATTAKAVKTLVDLDYVTRSKSLKDKRVNELYLTKNGIQISNRVVQVFEKLKMIYIKGFKETEYKEMENSLNKVLNNILMEINK